MKKGFLFSGNSKASSASATSNCTKTTPAGRAQKTQDENIPFIKANKDSTAGQHRFDEVQQAMQVNDAFAMNKGDIFLNQYTCRLSVVLHLLPYIYSIWQPMDCNA